MAFWHEENLLIDGELVPAEGGQTFETLNPATGQVLGVAADASLADTDRAIQAARTAFDTTDWSTDHELRQRCLHQLHEALVRHTEDLRPTMIAEVGCPVMLTHMAALESPIEMVRWYADLLDKFEWTEDLGAIEFRGAPHNRWVEKEAVGVVAAIVPYNYPLQITLAKVAPALAAGCTVVVKGPPDTPWVTQSFARIAAETDLPPGVLNVLSSSAVEVGEVLTTDPRVDMVSFTGSTAVGRRIMAAASDTVKKVFLELGGKSAYIVLDDADLGLAAMVASFTICSHAGQGCAITSRLLLPETKADEVIEQVKAMLEGVAVGDPNDPATMMGPLINARQWDKVDAHVKQAVAEGARLVTGGHRPESLPDGNFYAPTLLTDVDPDATIAQEETFGPVLSVIRFKDDDEAIAIANNSLFGLSGTVNTTDRERGLRVARAVRAGTISLNGGMWYGPDSPFGGYKQSGIGREMGVPGLAEYLETKTIAEPV